MIYKGVPTPPGVAVSVYLHLRCSKPGFSHGVCPGSPEDLVKMLIQIPKIRFNLGFFGSKVVVGSMDAAGPQTDVE